MNIIDRFHQTFKARLRKTARKALLLDKITATLAPNNPDELGDPSRLARTSIVFGMWMVFLVFGVFGLWSVVARLDSAAIASGRVVVDTNRKTISHLEGGIVEAIMVKNGDTVKAGDPLLRLREVRAKAQVDLLRSQYFNDYAIEARLVAERDEKSEIIFPKELIELERSAEQVRAKIADSSLSIEARAELEKAHGNDIAIAEIMENQRRIFKSRTENIRGQLDILETRVAKYDQEIRGLQMQADAMDSQIHLLNEEIAVVRTLVKEGNATKPRLLSLERQKAELIGRQGEYMALKAKARESIDETKLSMLNTKSEYQNKVVEELKQVQQSVAETREKITASRDVLDRIVIRAPVGGVINDLSIHTIDGIVKPGERIMDIIPLDDELTIEARIAPQDIDVVKPELKARVRLTAYKVRQVPALDGVVTFVSADQFIDERTGQSYYLARIRVDAKELADMENVSLYPGMPAETLIITGSRSFIAYMMSPISDSFNHSFRQQ